MPTSIKEPRELQQIYEHRFGPERIRYRQQLWATLCHHFFQRWVPAGATVLDLGCGYGEFINHVHGGRKLALDLNPKAAEFLHPDVELVLQDCTQPWPWPDNSLDVVFTSNVFEHLPDKLALKLALLQALRCLRPGGRLLALGPNIKHVGGAYWDFWDHFLCLTEASLAEAMTNNGFLVRHAWARFLPYTTVNTPRFPMPFVALYVRLPLLWRLFGRQFLVIAEKPASAPATPSVGG